MSIAKPRTASLIDTITAGYVTLNQRLWIITIPAALSALLWLTPPLPVNDLLGRPDLTNWGGQFGFTAADWIALSAATLARDARISLAWLNYLPILVPPVSTPLNPSPLTGGLAPLGAAVVLINLTTLLFSGIFLSSLSNALRDVQLHPLALLRQTLEWAIKLAQALAVVFGVGLILALPFLAISALVLATVPPATLGVALVWYIALFWVTIYTGFTPEALLMSHASPMRAIYLSFNVVRYDLFGTLSLLLVSLIITSGLAVIWQHLATNPVGLTIAIVASAYIGSGLSMARLLFYRQRWLGMELFRAEGGTL